MKTIASFTVNHLDLYPGVYVSRIDPVSDTCVTTFDLRMTAPNREPVMNTAEIHTIEHLGATFLRNHHELGPDVLYFGPMGCRTGFYLLLKGEWTSKALVPYLIQLCDFIAAFDGPIPGATPAQCGNFSDQNLAMAKYLAKRYLEVLNHITPDRLMYPE